MEEIDLIVGANPLIQLPTLIPTPESGHYLFHHIRTSSFLAFYAPFFWNYHSEEEILHSDLGDDFGHDGIHMNKSSCGTIEAALCPSESPFLWLFSFFFLQCGTQSLKSEIQMQNLKGIFSFEWQPSKHSINSDSNSETPSVDIGMRFNLAGNGCQELDLTEWWRMQWNWMIQTDTLGKDNKNNKNMM